MYLQETSAYSGVFFFHLPSTLLMLRVRVYYAMGGICVYLFVFFIVASNPKKASQGVCKGLNSPQPVPSIVQ